MTLQDAYYELRFETEYLRAKGEAFQTLFERLMGLAHKGDFMACRPWGKEGDRKNDGFLRSERRLFQVYAPDEMTATDATKKISEDFDGAKLHWRRFFDKWTFVHNATKGLPPHVQSIVLHFENQNPGITLDLWSLEELRLVFRKLSLVDKESWFGPVPTDETKHTLSFADLQVVIDTIAARPVPQVIHVREVPSGKIEANQLSEAVATLIKEGMSKAPLVTDFLSQWYDETLGDRLAEAFKEEYGRLHSAYSPNQVFQELQTWAGGDRRGTPDHELAVITIIAYYFERCDIFEEPRRDPR